MINPEYFFTPSANGTFPYQSQLDAIDPTLGLYAAVPDPHLNLRKEAQDVWDAYEQKNPQTISTADLKKNAIDNLETIPFRSQLEALDMPFEDDVVYTTQDIAASTDDDELLANVMANVYQFGNLSSSIFVAIPYLKKMSQQDLDQFSKETQQFIQDVTTSTEPFEMINIPMSQMPEAFTLIDTITKNQNPPMSSIVLHPLDKDATIIFINSTNINGMSIKQISDRLNQLANIKKAVNITKMKDIISSAQVDRNLDSQPGMDRNSDSISRGERIKNAKIKKLKSTKRIVALIKHDINKRSTSQRTNNVTKKVKKTYNKPNRREPNNDFKPGKTKHNVYRPNLHLYLDTSGSMSLNQYKEGIMAAIEIAQQLGTDIYLSSFSDTLAEPVLLDKIKSQRASKLMKRALKIPVLQSGTDFENVYNAIDQRATNAAKKGHAPEYSIILSDMEFWFSGGYKVPKAAQNTLHLMVASYSDGSDFKTSAYNAGILHIDKLLYEI